MGLARGTYLQLDNNATVAWDGLLLVNSRAVMLPLRFEDASRVNASGTLVRGMFSGCVRGSLTVVRGCEADVGSQDSRRMGNGRIVAWHDKVLLGETPKQVVFEDSTTVEVNGCGLDFSFAGNGMVRLGRDDTPGQPAADEAADDTQTGRSPLQRVIATAREPVGAFA